MLTQLTIYFSILGIGVVFLVVLYFMLRKSAENLPGTWKKALSLTKFRTGVLSLMIYFLGVLVSELITTYLGYQGIYNSFVISIGFTVYTPFLLGFLFIYTQTAWKRYSYILLYLILVGYLIIGGYFHPDYVLPYSSSLLFSCIYFLAALIHLTDLLMNPASEHFRFQLKINISILIYNILSSITTSFYWAATDFKLPPPELVFDINIYITIFYYFALDLIFVQKILKLRRI